MGPGPWLRLLLTLGAFWALGAHESTLGILGEAVVLRIPPRLQDLSRDSGEAAWKRLPRAEKGQEEEKGSKEILVKLSGGILEEFERGRLRFHRGDFSLEILNATREDGRSYEFSLRRGRREEVWELRLEVLEPVSRPEILILHRELSNGSCSLSLLCSSPRGDEISFSWGRNGSAGPCSGSGPVLNLSFPVPGAAPGCVCSARNRVSHRDRTFDTARCGIPGHGVPRVSLELLVPLVTLGLVIVIVIVTLRAAKAGRIPGFCDPPGQQEPPQGPPDPAGTTIYAQVQKPRGAPKGAAPAGSSSTIYTAATAPPPGPPGSPKIPQDPRTIYAGVSLPVG